MTPASHTATSVRRLPIVALLLADAVSRIGNAVTTVAVPLIALQLGGALATAAAGIAATLPLMIGGLIGGVVVDRLGFRRASIVADALSGLTVLAVPVLAALDALPLWALLVLVFASNLFDAPGMAARSSQIPELTELAGTSLTRVTSAHATASRTAVMIGAGTAGVLIAVTGPAAAMYVNAAAFAVAIILTIALVPRMALDRPDAEHEAGFDRAGLTAGIRFVWRTPVVKAIVVMVVITNAIDTAGMTVLKPLYAAELPDAGAALGAMVACFAGGALAGAVLYGLVGERIPRRPLYVVLFLLAGVPPYLTMALSPPFAVVIAVITLSGLAAGPLNPLIDTALYGIIPAGIRARVLGAITAGVTAAMPIGSALAGIGVETVGLTATLAIAAAAYLTAIVTTSFGRRWEGF